MPMISKCPLCMGIIQLDDGFTDPSMSMDCPRCRASFPLHEALDLMAEPLLEATVHGNTPENTSSGNAAYAVQGAAGAASYGLQQEATTPIGEVSNSPSAQADVESVTQGPKEPGAFSSTDQNQAEAAAPSDDATQDANGFDFAGLEPADPDANPFGSGEAEFSVTGGADADESIASRAAARAADGPSVVGTMIGVFGGGFFGLFGGYYLLCFFGGAQYNFLKLPLPGITQKLEEDDDQSYSDNLASDYGSSSISPPINYTPDNLGNAFPVGISEPVIDPTLEPTLVEDDFNVPITTPDEPVSPIVKGKPGTIVNAPSFSPDELGQQLKIVHDALRDPDSDISGYKGFEKVCSLAERLTFVDDSDGSRKTQDRQANSKKVIKEYANSEAQQVDVSTLAMDKYTTSGHDNIGIVITGLVLDIERPNDGLVVFSIQPSGSLETVTIVARTQLGAVLDSDAIFIGVIVPRPEELLSGYVGIESQVIYASAGARLRK